MPKKNKLTVDIKAIENDFLQIYCEAMEFHLAYGVLKDGRNYEIQLKITTDENDFLDDNQNP